VFNFYSSTEDILRVDDDIDLLDAVDIDVNLWMNFLPVGYDINTPYVWQIQEMYKGLDQIPWINAPGGGVSKYAGWGFVKKNSQHIKSRWARIPGHAPVKPFVVSNALNQANSNRDDYRESLKTDPLFRHEPEELFESGAEAFVAGTIGDDGGNLQYNTGDNNLDISQVKIHDWLLAKGFPSRTEPMGSAKNKHEKCKDVNFDMSDPDDGFMTNPGQWPHEDSDHNKEWRHSDWKNVPYVHTIHGTRS